MRHWARLPSVASGILIEIKDGELHPSDHDGLPVVAPHKLELDPEHLLTIYHVPANMGPADVDLPELPAAEIVPLEGLGRNGARFLVYKSGRTSGTGAARRTQGLYSVVASTWRSMSVPYRAALAGSVTFPKTAYARRGGR